MEAVKEALAHLEISEPRSHDYGPLLKSIAEVSDAQVRYCIERPPEPSITGALIESICDISEIIQLKYNDFLQFHQERTSPVSYLELIQRQYDENLHSDIIAALLNPEVCKKAAHEFFRKLISHATQGSTSIVPANSDSSLYSEREVRLDSVKPNISRDKGARRIDILAYTKSQCLVIENKVFSYESESQTEDYYNALHDSQMQQDKYYILLSPEGVLPQNRHFVPMSYLELYNVISGIDGTLLPKNSARNLHQFYLNEMASTIIQPKIQQLLFAQKYLRSRP